MVTFGMLICLLPIVHTLALSLSDKASATAGLVTLCPVNFTWASYLAILKDRQFFISLGNTIMRVGIGVPINVLFCILMAYPLSKTKKLFPQRNIYMWFMAFTMLFSGGLIPSYILIDKLGFINSIWALILPSAVPVYNVILLMNYFKGLPNELDEAARIDGAGPMKIMTGIFVPLAMPCIATIALFSIVGHWNSFFDGAIYMNTQNKIPLQTYIQQLVMDMNVSSSLSHEDQMQLAEVSGKSFNAAKVFVTMLPLVVLYPFVQRFFVQGIVIGSVKG
jgi:ABC-type glycerol-3-phosphate transport system permease component